MLNSLSEFLQSIMLSEIRSSSFSLVLCNKIGEDAQHSKEALEQS